MFIFGILLLISVSQISATKNYSVQFTSPSTFVVKIEDTVVINHTQLSPAIFVGQGQTIFKEALGNFHVRNYIQERTALSNVHKANTSPSSDDYYLTGGIYNVTMTLQTTAEHDLVMSFKRNGPPFTHSWIRLSATQDEKIYGGGEQFTHFNLRESSYNSLQYFSVLRADDKTYPIWTREQGVGRDKSSNTTFFADLKSGGGGDYSTTYFPQPTFISSRKHYFHFTSTSYMVFDFSVPSFHEVFIKGEIGSVLFKKDASFKNLVRELSGYLGRMPELPRWTYDGIIMGVQGGTEEMLKRYKEAKSAGVKIRGLWIQDWSGIINTSFGQRVFWNWKWNSTRYPGLDKTIQDLKKEDVHVTVYMNPNLNKDGELFKEANKNSYLVKNSTGNGPYLFNFGEFFCGIVDLTNPAAYNWYKEQIKSNIINLGIDGWMADFGEYLPVDANLTGGSGEQFHNHWPVLWAKLNREAVEETNKTGQVAFWMRAGHSGTSNYTTLMWAGDQNVDWSIGDGLPSTIPAALSLGLNGIGMTHVDIGGYTTFGTLGLKRSTELLLRSAEMAVFTPVMRTHEGNQPTFNVQMYSNADVLKQFERLVNIHYSLANYTQAAMAEYVTSGLPLQRPLFLMYENDPQTYDIKYQYMYGSDILVAPVTQPNRDTWNLYLPNDNWVYMWNNSHVTHGNIHVNAPLGLPPVFYRANSSFASHFRSLASYKRIPLPRPNPVKPSPSPCINNAQVYNDNKILLLIVFVSLLIKSAA